MATQADTTVIKIGPDDLHARITSEGHIELLSKYGAERYRIEFATFRESMDFAAEAQEAQRNRYWHDEEEPQRVARAVGLKVLGL